MANYYPLGGPWSIPASLGMSSADLLQLPYALSQASILSESQFRSEAKRRGVRLERRELEVLHRRRVLVPFYRVTQRPVCVPVPVPPDAARSAWPVYVAAAEGRLQDPSGTPFRPWPKVASNADLYYSHFQLLMLRALPHVFTRMRARRAGDDIVYELDVLEPHERDLFARGRALAVTLETLAPRYLPRIVHRYRDPADKYLAFVDDHDPAAEHAALLLDPDVVIGQADALLVAASFFDPLGKWHRVTRIADRGRWNELAFDALLAQEYRLAAEILLLFYEDEHAQGRAAPMPDLSTTWHEPRHDRIRVSQRERAETIMDFRLSDRPAVVLALEGPTELETARRVLHLFGHEELSPLINLVDLEGVNGNVKLLAHTVAVPHLDPDGYRGARVLAPLNALVVATDPEGRYATSEARAVVERTMKEEVLRSLLPALRTDSMRSDLDHLIFVRTWPAEFEFAHFTDTELARAIRAVVTDAPPLRELRAALRRCRDAGGPIKSVWARWKHQPSKLAVAEAAWPDLERRLVRSGARQPPIAALLVEVFRIAANVRRAREIAVPDPRPDGGSRVRRGSKL